MLTPDAQQYHVLFRYSVFRVLQTPLDHAHCLHTTFPNKAVKQFSVYFSNVYTHP